MTYRECYQTGVLRLEAAGVPSPALDARLLLEHVCKTNQNTLLAHGEEPVSEEQKQAYLSLLARREKRVPLQLLTGEQGFCGLSFLVDGHVLIPRQDTEILVEAALKHLKPGMEILDMCTGSGCILISLLFLGEKVKGTGTDISEAALRIAAENGKRLLSSEKQPEWMVSDLFSHIKNKYDMIVSNPPYIPSGEIDGLQPEVRDYEPRNALDGSEDGLLFYRKITQESSSYLKEGGFLLFEIGADQGARVKAIMEKAGFGGVEIIKDYAGLDRVAAGCR